MNKVLLSLYYFTKVFYTLTYISTYKHSLSQSIPISHMDNTELRMHFCAHCDYKSERKYNLKVHLRNKHKTVKEEDLAMQNGSPTEKMTHYCGHCDYKSDSRWCLLRHQSRKHAIVKKEVEECPLPPVQQPFDRDLMEDSQQIFKIYILLQRMKNKLCLE